MAAWHIVNSVKFMPNVREESCLKGLGICEVRLENLSLNLRANVLEPVVHEVLMATALQHEIILIKNIFNELLAGKAEPCAKSGEYKVLKSLQLCATKRVAIVRLRLLDVRKNAKKFIATGYFSTSCSSHKTLIAGSGSAYVWKMFRTCNSLSCSSSRALHLLENRPFFYLETRVVLCSFIEQQVGRAL